jgi:P4 family phage/plasmid primase-like protien
VLERLAAMAPEQTQSRNGRYSVAGDTRLDLPQWLADHDLEVAFDMPWQDGHKWVLSVCPWNREHTNRSAIVGQFSSGAVFAMCQHNGCSGKNWRDLRAVVGDHRDTYASAPSPTSSAAHDGPADAGPADFHFTDLGNAKRLVHRHGNNLRYVYEWKSWLCWDGKRWRIDNGKAIERFAKETVLAIYAEAAAEPDDGRRGELIKHAKASEKRERITAMIALAQSEDSTPVEISELDADHSLLNCANGTVDLRTGELLSHQRGNFITKLSPVSYDPLAECPLWLSFLQQILGGNESLIAFLKRALGYTATGDASEQVLFMLHGLGANGKSTFLETVRHILGDYARAAEFSTFLQKDHDPIRNDLARLVGVRFASAIEADAGRRLSESVIKQVTGGEPIPARFLFKEFFEFVPVFKLWLACNHRPVVVGTDEAIWRRIHLIPFTVTIPAADRDQKLPIKLRKEAAGILNWLLRGELEWQRSGLQPPEEVQAATNAYREESDILGGFIRECCVLKANAIVPASEFYTAYQSYCDSAGEVPVTQKTFGMRLTERGIERRKTGHENRWHWRGIKLQQPDPHSQNTSDGFAESAGTESSANPCDPCEPLDPISTASTAHEGINTGDGSQGFARVRTDLPMTCERCGGPTAATRTICIKCQAATNDEEGE